MSIQCNILFQKRKKKIFKLEKICAYFRNYSETIANITIKNQKASRQKLLEVISLLNQNQ